MQKQGRGFPGLSQNTISPVPKQSGKPDEMNTPRATLDAKGGAGLPAPVQRTPIVQPPAANLLTGVPTKPTMANNNSAFAPAPVKISMLLAKVACSVRRARHGSDKLGDPSMAVTPAMLKAARARLLEKKAFVPMTPQGAAPDPSQGQPPPQGAQPGMDPAAAAGGAPAGAAPPMDPAAAGGAPPGGDPAAGGQAVQIGVQDLMQFMQMMAQQGGVLGGAPNEAPKGKGQKINVEQKITELEGKIDKIMNALGLEEGLVPASQDAGAQPPAGGMPTMGAGVDPSQTPPPPQMPGSPAGGGEPSPEPAKQASARHDELKEVLMRLLR